MNPTRAQVLAFVNSKPHGVSTAQVISALGGPIYSVSGNLSKLAAYGFIDAKPFPNRGRKMYLWCPKQEHIMEAAE